MSIELGELIHELYEEFLVIYRGDKDLASVATGLTIQDILLDQTAHGTRSPFVFPDLDTEGPSFPPGEE